MEDRKEQIIEQYENQHSQLPKWHQLIVVGNGYDLECDLRSRFIHFFEPRFKVIDSVTSYDEDWWSAKIEPEHLTLWDFILRRNACSDWCDIESAIKRWVVSTRPGFSIPTTVHEAHRVATRYPFATGASAMAGTRLASEQDDGSYIYGNMARLIWLTLGAEKAQAITKEDLVVLLQSDLTRLELAFDAYLQRQENDNYDYILKAENLFEQIRDDGLPDQTKRTVETSILTFNYTNPFTHWLIGVNGHDVVNIHGRLGGGIIFGIDGKDCMGNDVALPFTKTYRVAVSGTPIVHELFHVSHPGTVGASTEAIKFYGHSLGEADYSYFQSLFDGVDLYGSSTKLVFYYRPWRDKDGKRVSEETARTSMVKSVARLLTVYGSTMDNEDHGKNLMHKLLLEGRLEVKRI